MSTTKLVTNGMLLVTNGMQPNRMLLAKEAVENPPAVENP